MPPQVELDPVSPNCPGPVRPRLDHLRVRRQLVPRVQPPPLWMPPQGLHSAENVGSVTFRACRIELKETTSTERLSLANPE